MLFWPRSSPKPPRRERQLRLKVVEPRQCRCCRTSLLCLYSRHMRSRQSLLLLRRNMFVAWLAAALTVVSPVLAYAHEIAMPGGLLADQLIDYCGAAVQHHHVPQGQPEKSKQHSVPHCPYCPGFAAGAALGQCAPAVTPQPNPAAPPSARSHISPDGRRFVRIAQPRAPPTQS
jgi:hypothetical protein